MYGYNPLEMMIIWAISWPAGIGVAFRTRHPVLVRRDFLWATSSRQSPWFRLPHLPRLLYRHATVRDDGQGHPWGVQRMNGMHEKSPARGEHDAAGDKPGIGAAASSCGRSSQEPLVHRFSSRDRDPPDTMSGTSFGPSPVTCCCIHALQLRKRMHRLKKSDTLSGLWPRPRRCCAGRGSSGPTTAIH
jgi:hypothetical protein